MKRFQFEYPMAYRRAWAFLSSKDYGLSSNADEMWITVHGSLAFGDQLFIDNLLRQEDDQRKAEAR